MKACTVAMTAIAVLVFSAALAGTVSGIDNCCFVNRQCQSDQDWVNGYWAFQNNQCSAPTGSLPTSAAPAQVDNCCYVDRLCTSESDWIGGWHAYQAGQCSTPSQSPSPASSQPAGPAPANIDNCCYVDRQCHTDLDWMGGWHAYRAGQCGAPAGAQTVASYQPGGGVILRTASGIVIGHTGGGSILPSTTPLPVAQLGQTVSYTYSNCCQYHWQCNSAQDWAEGDRFFQTNNHCSLPGLISIVGNADFVDFYAQRLDQLKNRAPHRYDYVLSGLNKIQQHWDDSAGYVTASQRTFFVGWTGPIASPWNLRRSAVIVHEACHVHRYDAGYDPWGSDRETVIREEVFCREMELQVLIELGADPSVIEWARDMVARTRTG